MDLSRCIQRFGDADFLFAAQKNGAAALRQSLGRPVEWLPLACDPDIHRPIAGELKCHDVAFVGNIIGHERQRLLEQLSQRYPSSWFGQALFDELSRMYSRAHVGFNCSVADDLNMRLFEIPACGIPLITNHIEENGLDELFEAGRHLLTFRTDDELYAQIDRLLHDEAYADKMATEGHLHVLQNHTYRHRMVQLLQTVTQTKATVSVGGKSHDYFEFDRPDVRALIPVTANRILDIGCASGRLGQALKSERDCHVTGIEANSVAAGTATTRLDQVIEASMETLPESAIPDGSFDCIVLADVLEHLRNPVEVLRKCRQWLSDSGSLVISVPNSRHHSVISGLIDGNWTYERAGLLDDDHVRCFTRRELEKLLYRTGFEITERTAIPGSGYGDWRQSGDPGTVQIGNLSIAGLAPMDAEEFFIYQHLVRSQPRPRRDHGLTSIVIVTFNQLWATRQCVDSILMRTDEAVELIFVDNGSTDGTPDYLQSIPGARVILNSDNRGFAPAVNQGLQIASGQQLLLLNNDCIVTTGWLDGLLEALYDDSANGLVGPVSNNVSGEQQIPVTYADLTSLDGFAWDCRSNRQLTETDRLIGFCMLFRREVMDQVGLLDERFEIGCFEDDDFCRRARNAGFRALIANHVCVHHFGSATFRGSGLNFAEILRTNEQRYRDKWESAPKPRQTRHRAVAHIAGPANLSDRYSILSIFDGIHLLQRKHIRLSLCMIVRDNEDTIEACLDSIYPCVDEIIIIDTGSKDRTIEICRRFGARIFEFPWCDDFSAARNVSLQHARGEWIFWMDSDDIITEEQGRKLRALAYGPHQDDLFGYVMQVHCKSSEPGQMTVVDHVKLFRNRAELRFEHRIHEQILPSIRRAGGNVAFTDIFVVHSGSDPTPTIREIKLERDFRILAKELVDRPDHPFVLFNLGMTHDDAGNYENAIEFLQRCIDVSGDGESQLAKAYSLLVNSLQRLSRTEEAITTASTALALYPGDKELLFRRGNIFLETNRFEDAVQDFQKLLAEQLDRTFRSFDPSIVGYKAHHSLAIAYQQLQHTDEATREWQLAIRDCPQFAVGWLSLVRHHRLCGEDNAASQLTNEMQATLGHTAEAAIALAIGHESKGEILDVEIVLESAFDATRDPSCLDELARILIENGSIGKSVVVLHRLLDCQPDNASVLHNLGMSLHLDGQTSEAIGCLQRCLQIDPDRIQTICLLAVIYQESGDLASATELLKNAFVRHPNHPELLAALLRVTSNPDKAD